MENQQGPRPNADEALAFEIGKVFLEAHRAAATVIANSQVQTEAPPERAGTPAVNGARPPVDPDLAQIAAEVDRIERSLEAGRERLLKTLDELESRRSAGFVDLRRQEDGRQEKDASSGHFDSEPEASPPPVPIADETVVEPLESEVEVSGAPTGVEDGTAHEPLETDSPEAPASVEDGFVAESLGSEAEGSGAAAGVDDQALLEPLDSDREASYSPPPVDSRVAIDGPTSVDLSLESSDGSATSLAYYPPPVANDLVPDVDETVELESASVPVNAGTGFSPSIGQGPSFESGSPTSRDSNPQVGDPVAHRLKTETLDLSSADLKARQAGSHMARRDHSKAQRTWLVNAVAAIVVIVIMTIALLLVNTL